MVLHGWPERADGMLGATNSGADTRTDTGADAGKWPCGLHDVCMDRQRFLLSDVRRWHTAVEA